MVGAGLLAVLCGCSAAPAPLVTAVVAAPTSSAPSSPPPPTASVAPTSAAPSVTASPTPDAPRVIGFGFIGDLTIDLTARQIGDRLGATTQLDQGNPACATAQYVPAGSGDDAVLAGALSILADSRGASGRVDVLELGGPTSADPARLPRTAAGIGIGSTLDEVRAAYSDGLTETPAHYEPKSIEAAVTGPDSTELVFHVGPDRVVFGISTGRLPEVRYVEHCL